MSIDRIGKRPGGLTQPTDAGSPEAPNRTQSKHPAEKTFEVRHTSTSVASASTQAIAPSSLSNTSPLNRLRAGEIDINAYVDRKVDEAMAPLRGLGPSEAEAIKEMLRDQMSSDPAIADLIKQATGHEPPSMPDMDEG